jgi:hypothetical protein
MAIAPFLAKRTKQELWKRVKGYKSPRIEGHMTQDDVWAICERVTELQALLHDHVECGKHAASDVVTKVQAILSEPELLQAMYDVGYFPANTPPTSEAEQDALVAARSPLRSSLPPLFDCRFDSR